MTPSLHYMDDPSACVRCDVIGNAHAGMTVSVLVPVTRLCGGANLCVFQSHFQYGSTLGWRCTLQPA